MERNFHLKLRKLYAKLQKLYANSYGKCATFAIFFYTRIGHCIHTTLTANRPHPLPVTRNPSPVPHCSIRSDEGTGVWGGAWAESGGVLDLELIAHARVPLVMFVDLKTGIACDISIDNDAARLKSTVLRWITQMDPRCRQLIFLVGGVVLGSFFWKGR